MLIILIIILVYIFNLMATTLQRFLQVTLGSIESPYSNSKSAFLCATQNIQ